MPQPIPALWADALAASDVLRDVDPASVARLVEGATELSLAPGEVLVEQGDAADALYVVLEGRLEIGLRNEAGHRVTLDDVGVGSIVGEIALLLGGRRSSTVQSLGSATVLRLPGRAIERLLAEDEKLGPRFNSLLQSRLQRLQLASYVSELFGPLRREVLDEIEREVEWVSLPSGEVLFRKGEDPADGVYIVLGGRVRVVLEEADGTERNVAEVGRGESVGEMALLGDSVRSATVYAVRDSQLARLSRGAFDRLVARYPDAMFQIARLLVVRLERATQGVPPTHRLDHSFAIVWASPEVPAQEFVEQLCAAFSEHGETLWLSSQRIEGALGRPGIAQLSEGDAGGIRFTQWLLECESAHRVVVYEGDREWSAWTRRIARVADHVLIVGDARAEPERRALERQLEGVWERGRTPRRSLVLLQPRDGRSYSGTQRWLDARDVDDHFHVRTGVAEDFSRLARLLTDRGIGLVLGGGGAPGFAHIGVLRAMRQLGIPIDAIGGTSIGALVGGLYALGYEPEAMVDLGRTHARRLLDPTFPMVSLFAGHRIGRAFRQAFGEHCIEDLALPYFCMSTNLSRAEEVEHRRGLLAAAVRASIALPGILPPVPVRGDLLVDGGLMNNIPVDVMNRLTGHGPVVAVDVSPDVDLRADVDFGTELSGWRVLWSRLNPFAERVSAPSILSVLGRTVVVGSILAQRECVGHGDSELYLLLPVGAFGFLDFKAIDTLVRCGFESSREPLRSWWETLRLRSYASARPGSASS